MIKINLDKLSIDLIKALMELSEVLYFEISNEGMPVYAQQTGGNEVEIDFNEKGGFIYFSKLPQFFKAFALLLKGNRNGIKFSPAFEDLAMMADCSRSAVLSVEGTKNLIKYLAVMGYDTLMLYTEDTYEVKEYPYMGYMRGRYTKQEISEIRDYCMLFGIELVPCIQTLAHLGQTLRWGEHSNIKDIDNILLIDEEKTYEFIEACIKACSEMFTSKRINIGMDEAHQVGMGNYLKQHGYTDRSTLMIRHLKRVADLCLKYGYKPMMWSDMFFYLQFNGNYYSAEGSFSDTIKGMLPEEVSVIYWDYYSSDKARYDKMFALHKDLHDDVSFAGGAWRWTGATPNNTFSLKATETALTEAEKHNIKKVIATAWGDDGGEASVFSILPTLQLYSEMNYHHNTELLKENFLITSGIEFDTFMLVDSPGTLPANDFSSPMVNPAKYMLFQDVFMGLFDLHVIENEDAVYFAKTAEKLNVVVLSLPEKSSWWNLFKATELLCEVLSIKCGMGIEIRKQYKAKNMAVLEKIANNGIPELIGSIKSYYAQFKKLWMQTNKVIGLEIQDIRYGGLIMRLTSIQERLLDFVSGRTESLIELEQEILPYSYGGNTRSGNCYTSESMWGNIVSANALGGV